MVSKTSMREAVRAHRWREVEEGLAARPDLKGVTDERGRNWLHLACMAPGEDEASIRTVQVLLALGFGIDDAAFTERTWRATPLWHVIARGRNLKLAEHLLTLGADPDHCLFAAVWNEDREAIRLLLRFGADIEEGVERGDTVFARRGELEQVRPRGGAAGGRRGP
ncbi:MAG TPA: hypothetical protein VGF77_18415 [Allosphingosinicella sp.]|jgi:hypothetical protein